MPRRRRSRSSARPKGRRSPDPRRAAKARPDERPAPQLDLFRDTPKFHSPVPTDREPILREWRARYRAIEKELAEVSSETEEFQLQALPGYRAWIAREFGEELTALRELARKIEEMERIALATIEEARASDCPEAEAYQIVLLRKERGEDLFPSPEDETDDWDSGWEEVDPERDYRGEARGHRESSAEDDARTEEADEASRAYFREKRADEARAAEETGETDRLKALYRKLAFKLHPDTNPAATPREREIWDQVQSAYAERDLARLEMLRAWVESGAAGGLESLTHLGTLRALVIEKYLELRATRQELNRFKKDPAWKYWRDRKNARRLDAIREGLERELFQEFGESDRRIRQLELRFDQWRRQLGPRRRKPRK